MRCRTFASLLLALVVLMMTTGCGQPPVIEVDQSDANPLKENMINANRVVAQSESTQIEAYLQRHGWKATPLTCGAYYQVQEQGNGMDIAPDDRVAVSYHLETLDGTPIYKYQTDTLTVGRREQTLALDELLQQTDYHSKVCMVAPSASAYGVVGDGDAVSGRMVIVYRITDIVKIDNERITNK